MREADGIKLLVNMSSPEEVWVVAAARAMQADDVVAKDERAALAAVVWREA